MRKTSRALRRRLTPRLAWDLFMVYLAVVNLGLILFDMTYLWLRPTYNQYAPVICRLYDPVKGIVPHPVTVEYEESVASLEAALTSGAGLAEREVLLRQLREQSAEMLGANPFERSGQEKSLTRIFVGMRQFLERESPAWSPSSAQAISDRFWSTQSTAQQLSARTDYFRAQLSSILTANYFRRFDAEGDLVDHFWRIDLPFLLIFAAEFLCRWIMAVRHRAHPRWFFFPIFNWYDLLGIMPVKGLRIFRLFRIASIYIRLKRSEHTSVGDDVVSRTVAYFANIISEEISDMVALRILNETQEEIRDGTHKKIIRSVTDRHRDALATQLAVQLRDVLTSEQVKSQARGFLEVNLERSVESAEALRRLPIPDALLRPLVSSVGEAIFDALVDTLGATLSTEPGQRAVKEMISESIDGLVDEVTAGELEEVVREISLQAIEHMKDTVAVRKWTLPDQPRRRPFTWEIVD